MYTNLWLFVTYQSSSHIILLHLHTIFLQSLSSLSVRKFLISMSVRYQNTVTVTVHCQKIQWTVQFMISNFLSPAGALTHWPSRLSELSQKPWRKKPPPSKLWGRYQLPYYNCLHTVQTKEWGWATSPKREDMKKLLFEPQCKENVEQQQTQQQTQYKSHLVNSHTNRTDQHTHEFWYLQDFTLLW